MSSKMEKEDWIAIWYKCLSCHRYFQDSEKLLVHRKESECSKYYPEILEQLEEKRNKQSEQEKEAANKYSSDLNDFEAAILNEKTNVSREKVDKQQFTANSKLSKKNIPLDEDDTVSSSSKVMSWLKVNNVSRRVPIRRRKGKRGIKFTRKFFKCDKCRKRFTSKGTLKTHMLCHQNIKPFNCSFCSKSFRQKGNLNVHEDLHRTRRSYKCQDCDLCFLLPAQLKNHAHKVHSKNVTLKCGKCTKVFPRLYLLKKHLQMCGKVFSCDKCKKIVRSPYHLKMHRLVHENKEDKICKDCGKEFKYVSLLNYHIYKVHNETILNKKTTLSGTIHKCSKCERVFPHLYLVKKHLLICGKTFRCKKCQKTFKFPNILKAHQRVHENKEKIVCKDCGKEFKCFSYLKYHRQKNHTGKNTTIWHGCSKCNRKFKTIRELQNHVRVHKKFYSYKCAICQTCFGAYTDLSKHVTETHKSFDKSKNIKVFECNYCSQGFRVITHLNSHLLIHENLKPYKCKFCDYTARQPTHLKIHESNMH